MQILHQAKVLEALFSMSMGNQLDKSEYFNGNPQFKSKILKKQGETPSIKHRKRLHSNAPVGW